MCEENDKAREMLGDITDMLLRFNAILRELLEAMKHNNETPNESR
jgi:hypothetical protein